MFIRVYLIACTLTALMVAGLNYFVDPAGAFYASGVTETQMARALAASDNGNLVIPRNYDERRFQNTRLTIESYQPHTVVIGSSRVLQFTTATYGSALFNLGMSGATIQDIAALLVKVYTRWQPKTVVIGLDPLVLQASASQSRWKALMPEYEAALHVLKPAQVPLVIEPRYSWMRWLQLFNRDYTLESLGKLWQWLHGAQALQLVDSDAPRDGQDLIRKDGSRVYHRAYVNRSREEVAQNVAFWARYPFEGSQRTTTNDALLDTLLTYVRARSKVVIVLAPYHPDAYASIIKRFTDTPAIEHDIRALAKRHGLKVIGSYDPARTPCTADDFFDGAHPKGSCIAALVRSAR